jgi:NitT/TauT family transport system substrate-binding protein
MMGYRHLSRSMALPAVVLAIMVACTPAPTASQPTQKVADSTKPAATAAPQQTTPQQPAAAKSEPKALRKFTFILDFLPYGEYTPYYTALEKGWYREEGLDVEILRGAGSGDTVKRIAAGQGHAGSADFGVILAAKANEDVKVRAIAAYMRQPGNALFVRADSGIASPKDLPGKTISTTPGNSNQVLFPVVAQTAGISVDSVKWATMDATAMGPALIAGKVDAAPFGAQHEARLQKQAKEQGVTLKRIDYSDYGLDVFSMSIFAREEAIEKEADSLRAFLRATIRGMNYVFAGQNHEEGAKYVVKFNPEVDLEAAIGASQVAGQLSFNSEITSGRMAVGQFETGRLEKTRDLMTEYLQLKQKLPIEVLYTNDLLPEKK